MSSTALSVIWCSTIPPVKKLVLLTIADGSDEEGVFIFNGSLIKHLARYATCRPETISTIFNELLGDHIIYKLTNYCLNGELVSDHYQINFDLISKEYMGGIFYGY